MEESGEGSICGRKNCCCEARQVELGLHAGHGGSLEEGVGLKLLQHLCH